jgi:hypothetical protein
MRESRPQKSIQPGPSQCAANGDDYYGNTIAYQREQRTRTSSREPGLFGDLNVMRSSPVRSKEATKPGTRHEKKILLDYGEPGSYPVHDPPKSSYRMADYSSTIQQTRFK